METDLRYYIYSVSNILTVGVHLSRTPSISGPGSATVEPFTYLIDFYPVSLIRMNSLGCVKPKYQIPMSTRWFLKFSLNIHRKKWSCLLAAIFFIGSNLFLAILVEGLPRTISAILFSNHASSFKQEDFSKFSLYKYIGKKLAEFKFKLVGQFWFDSSHPISNLPAM